MAAWKRSESVSHRDPPRCSDPTTAPGEPWAVGYSWCVDLSAVEVGAVSSLSLFGAVAALSLLLLCGDGLSRRAEVLRLR